MLGRMVSAGGGIFGAFIILKDFSVWNIRVRNIFSGKLSVA